MAPLSAEARVWMFAMLLNLELSLVITYVLTTFPEWYAGGWIPSTRLETTLLLAWLLLAWHSLRSPYQDEAPPPASAREHETTTTRTIKAPATPATVRFPSGRSMVAPHSPVWQRFPWTRKEDLAFAIARVNHAIEARRTKTAEEARTMQAMRYAQWQRLPPTARWRFPPPIPERRT